MAITRCSTCIHGKELIFVCCIHLYSTLVHVGDVHTSIHTSILTAEKWQLGRVLAALSLSPLSVSGSTLQELAY